MTDVDVPDTTAPSSEPAEQAAEPAPRTEPIESRFLFVDVAAQRAKQLRRGALPRVPRESAPRKLERIAMEEVRQGLIQYSVPPTPGRQEGT